MRQLERLFCSVIAATCLAAVGYGQTAAPPILPCAVVGQSSNVPCLNPATGKVQASAPNTAPPVPGMINPLTLPALPVTPIVIPKFQPYVPPKPVQGIVVGAPPWGQPQEPEVQQNVTVQQNIEVNTNDVYTEQMRENYQAGQQVGTALGGLIYNRRLRHAINKACFDRGAKGWRLPSGRVIMCSDWMAAHPRHARGVPANLTVQDSDFLNQYCRVNKNYVYTGETYSCKAWKKYSESDLKQEAEHMTKP
jgi:hypothetical protein